MQVTSLACDQMSFRGRCSVPRWGMQAANWRGQASLLLGSSAAAACEHEAPSSHPRIGEERMVRCNPTKRLGAVFAGACLTNPQAGASTKPDHQGLSGKSSTSSKSISLDPAIVVERIIMLTDKCLRLLRVWRDEASLSAQTGTLAFI